MDVIQGYYSVATQRHKAFSTGGAKPQRGMSAATALRPPVRFGANPTDGIPNAGETPENKPRKTIWQKLFPGLNREPEVDKPFLHIPEYFEDFLETSFMNDDWRPVTGKEILAYFVQNRAHLDGRQGPAGYLNGQKDPGKAYSSKYLWALDTHFGFRNRTSQILMTRNLIESRILMPQEEYVDPATGERADLSSPAYKDPSSVRIVHRLYLTQRAEEIFKVSQLPPEKQEPYKADRPDIFPRDEDHKLTTRTPFMGEARTTEIAPGALRRLGILLATVIPLSIGIAVLSNQSSQKPNASPVASTSSKTGSTQPTPPATKSANPTSKGTSKNASTTPVTSESAPVVSNRFATVDEAIEALKQNRLNPVVKEISHNNGFYTYVFSTRPGTPQEASRVMTLPNVDLAQKSRLTPAFQQANVTLVAEEPPPPVITVPTVQAPTESGGINSGTLIGGGLLALFAISILIQLANRGGGNSKLAKKQMEFLDRQLKHLERADNFGKHRGAEMEENIETRFSDVGGNHIAKQKFTDLLQKIKKRVMKLPVDLPRGILLEGPPGNGKTLMARALAGEAGVPFVSLSGSDFNEMYVGVGASRIRDLFQQARQKAQEKGACIVFIDEIDSLAKKRLMDGAGSGASDERESTLNALLKEMDGFEQSDNIVVLAATNRKDLLDPALLTRRKRFSHIIHIGNPQSDTERQEILAIHAKRIFNADGLSFENDSVLGEVASICRGLSGDGLEAVIKGAADRALKAERTTVTLEDCIESFQTNVFGDISLNKPPAEEVEKTGRHEFGHMLAGIPGGIKPFVISMFQRNESLGRVVVDPRSISELSKTKRDYLAWVLMLLGGVAAEEAKYGDLGRTSGLSSDIDKVRKQLRQMLTYAMFDNNYALDVLDPEKDLTPSQTRLMNHVIKEGMKAAKAIMTAVGEERMSAMVTEAMAMDKELIGPEAVAFAEKHIPADLRREIETIAGAFFSDPSGKLRRQKERAAEA